MSSAVPHIPALQRPLAAPFGNGVLALLGGSVLLYAASLVLPAVRCVSGAGVSPGWALAVYGWISLAASGTPAWLANPLYGSALVLIGLRKLAIALCLGLLAFAVSLSALALYNPSANATDEENALAETLVELHPGFWCWVAAPALLSAACVVALWQRTLLPAGDAAADSTNTRGSHACRH